MKPYDYYYLAKKNILLDADQRGRITGTIKKGSRVHISAVCGKAMASVACMLQEFGCPVTGSDVKFSPPMSDVLDARGIVRLEPSLENLENIDILVVGNALRPDAIEVVGARERNIPMISGSEAVAQMFADKRSLVVAGTHGKTTTSALLTHVFLKAGKHPAYMIGGVFQKSDDSYSIGNSDTRTAIYEGDEYNCAFFDRAPKFLRYNPTSIILTSIEHDHLDLYPSFEDYKQAFQFLIDDLPANGFLVIHQSTLPYVDTTKCMAKVFVYGDSQSLDVYYDTVNTTSEGTTFSFHAKNISNIEDIHIPMFGEYNVSNATAVCTLALLEGLPQQQIIEALSTFSGTRERQELIGTRKDNIAVIRDYAHHPTAVTVTLDGLRLRYPNRRIISVFEPRSASSLRKASEERYGETLKQSDISIIISPVLKETDDKKNFIDTSNVKNIIETAGKIAYEAQNAEEAFNIVSKITTPNDVVVFMTSGDMEGIPEKFLKDLS